MKYQYYKAQKGNFGDDLNGWLWPRIFKGLSDDSGRYFIGIGSLLCNDSPLLKEISNEKKIAFGTGIRPAKDYTNFLIDEDLWNIKFLRGPLSSFALGNKYEYIADAAYALRQIDEYQALESTPKKYEISLMPYFHSVEYFDWKAICKELGYHYISPLSEDGVEFTLKEIAASKVLITEAMHGAIVADILRVPWHRFILTTPYTEGERISEFKWNDWLQSIQITNAEPTVIPFYRKTFIHKWVKLLTINLLSVSFYIKSNTKKQLISKLSLVKNYSLSKDEILSEIDKNIRIKINEVIAENS